MSSDDIPAEAQRLHQEGREAGGAGDAVRALELFHRAHELAPTWAYPPYDMAFTYLLADHVEEAETWYAHVDKLEPRGFFTAKASLDTLSRERSGELPAGFSKAYAMLEWEAPDEKRTALEQITENFPAFARGWKDLAALLHDDDAKLAAMDRGLACEVDDETYGVLILNKALLMQNRGNAAEAKRLVRDLVGSPRCTMAAETMVKTFFADAISPT